jgi:hypothetical protein
LSLSINGGQIKSEEKGNDGKRGVRNSEARCRQAFGAPTRPESKTLKINGF